MRVFVAGATGAIGRPLLPKLVAAGDEVTAISRSEEKANAIRAAGARAVVCDVFDGEALAAAMVQAAPEAVVHQLTALPDTLDFRSADAYGPTNRLRTEGTRNLLEGATAAGASRLVCQSIAFAYEPAGGRIKDEDAPLLREAAGVFGDAVRAIDEMERAVLGHSGLEGLVLRYGYFYGPGTYFADDGSTAAEVRRRRMPVVGRGQGIFSFVHVEDAADATVAALRRGAAGIYNVVDDDPAPMADWLPAYAEAIGAKRPLRVPKLIARLVAGREAAALATTLRGAANAKAKRELGWRPARESWRQGFSDSLG